jgi:cyclophilin family peptidyl-prolyl cis-trans isomerase
MKRLIVNWLTPIAICLIVLTACGMSDKSNPPTTTSQSISATDPDADIKSGCWKAADRGAGVGIDANGAYQQWKRPPDTIIDTGKTYKATLVTSGGTIELVLYPQDAPIAVNSFICLAKAGYFDSTTFHRIVKDFVIQGGDPTGTGRGGPGYQFDDEPVTKNYDKGTLAMANSGPNTNGSQFFICTDDVQLAKNYTIFGKVVGGMDVVDALNNTPTKSSESGEQSVPIDPVNLVSVTIVAS